VEGSGCGPMQNLSQEFHEVQKITAHPALRLR